MNNEAKGMLLGFIGVSAFGLTLPATKLVLPYLDPVFIGLGRAILAAIFAAIFLFWFKEKIPNKKQWSQLSIVSLGVIVGFPVLSSWAMQYVPASHGGVVAGILPLMTTVVGVVIGHERPSIGFWITSLFGSILVIVYALLQGSGKLHVADIALLGAIISAAIGYAVGAKLSKQLGGWQVICWSLMLAFPFIIFPAIYYAPINFLNFPASAYVSFFYLALVSQLFAFFAWYKGLALGGIARVSQTQLAQPFITIFASVFILNEVIDFITILFALLVIGIVWLGKKMPIHTKV